MNTEENETQPQTAEAQVMELLKDAVEPKISGVGVVRRAGQLVGTEPEPNEP